MFQKRNSLPEAFSLKSTQLAKRERAESHDLDPATWGASESQKPPAEMAGSAAQARPVSAYVSATADGSSEPVRFCAYLTGANNNGTPTGLKNLLPLLAIILGIASVVAPRFLNVFVAVFLIAFGILGLGLVR